MTEQKPEPKWILTDKKIKKIIPPPSYADNYEAEFNLAYCIAKEQARHIAERLSKVLDASPCGERIGNIENAITELLSEIERS